SFINEMARICERVDADVKVVSEGMGMDRRIGPLFLDAGIGYGGSCFPKDVKALARMAETMGYHPELLDAVMEINLDQRTLVVEKLREVLGGLRDQVIGILGLAYKPNTDDVREAPAIDVIENLLQKGATVRAYDPKAMPVLKLQMNTIQYCKDPYAVATVADGWRVVCVDNLVTGAAKNVAHLREHKSFESIQHNVSEPLYMDDGVDAVLHFASPASPIDYADHPIATLKVGTLGTHNMLGLARAKNALFLLASTSEVYGDPQVTPQPETYWGNVNPLGPRAVYDEAKRAAEAFTMAYHRAHGMKTRIIRIFNTYGPRMRINDGRAVPNFLLQALKNEPITVFGDGSQTRSLCYVDDLIEGVVRLLDADFSDPVNLGTDDEITMLQLANGIRRLCGSTSEIVYRPLPEDDPKQRRPDLTRARRLLGWEPRTSLEAGLVKTIAYFRERLTKR